MKNNVQKLTKILRKNHVVEKIGLSGSTIWRMEKAKQFPQRLQLGKRSVGWYEHEINAWIESRQSINIAKE